MIKRSGPARRPPKARPRGPQVAPTGRLLALVALLALAGRASSGQAADAAAPPEVAEAAAPGAATPLGGAGAAHTDSAARPGNPSPQAPGAPGRMHRPPGARGQFTLEARLQRLSRSLGLSADQQTKVRAILTRRQALALQIHRSASPSVMDRVRKFQALDSETVKRISSVLTDEQRRKFQPPQAPADAIAPPPASVPPTQADAH